MTKKLDVNNINIRSHRFSALALVIDCYTRELLGWHLSRSGKAKTAEAALEQALIARFGTLGRVQKPFLLRSDNGLVFTSRSFTALVRSYGLQQEFITPLKRRTRLYRAHLVTIGVGLYSRCPRNGHCQGILMV